MRPGVRYATLDGYVGLAPGLRAGPGTAAGGRRARPSPTWPSPTSGCRPCACRPAAGALGGRESGPRGLRPAAGRPAPARPRSGPLSVVLRQEPDLRSALDLLIRYEHSYNEALRLRLDEARGPGHHAAVVRVRRARPDPAGAGAGDGGAARASSASSLGAAVGAAVGVLLPPGAGVARRPPAVFGPRLQFGHEFTGLVFYAEGARRRHRGRPTRCCGRTPSRSCRRSAAPPGRHGVRTG